VLARSKEILRNNLTTLTQWIDEHVGLLSFIPPQAGGMAFVRYEMAINSTELVNRLIAEKNVFPIPGDAFGVDQYLRIGIGSPARHLGEGLRRIGEFLSEKRLRLRTDVHQVV